MMAENKVNWLTGSYNVWLFVFCCCRIVHADRGETAAIREMPAKILTLYVKDFYPKTHILMFSRQEFIEECVFHKPSPFCTDFGPSRTRFGFCPGRFTCFFIFNF